MSGPAPKLLSVHLRGRGGPRAPAAVEALWDAPPRPRGPALVLWHGSGSDMDEPSLAVLCEELASLGCLVVRPRLPYRQRAAQSGRRCLPDPLEHLVDAAVATLAGLESMLGPPASGWILGGRSLGARVAAHAAVQGAPARGLLLLGYPLTPPRAARVRANPFGALRVPTLCVQGSRDAFGGPEALRAALAPCPAPWRVLAVEGADHGFAQGRGRPAGAALRGLGGSILGGLGELVPGLRGR